MLGAAVEQHASDLDRRAQPLVQCLDVPGVVAGGRAGLGHGGPVYGLHTADVTPAEKTDADHVRPATPTESADVAAMHAANRSAWDQAAERYEGWLAEAIELIRGGGTNLFDAEVELIGDLHGRCARAIHLQCAGGRDTLSLWNLGADEVVGVDFSPRMLELAARLSAATGAPARWVLSDVLETPHELDGTGDLVYTGRGSLIWLQDLDAWAAVVARLLSPHRPVRAVRGPSRRSGSSMSTTTATGSRPTTTTSAGRRRRRGWAPEYIDHLSIDEADQSWKFARAWTLGEVITALLGAGLRLERVTEHPIDWWGGHADVRDGGARPDPALVFGRRPRTGRLVAEHAVRFEGQFDEAVGRGHRDRQSAKGVRTKTAGLARQARRVQRGTTGDERVDVLSQASRADAVTGVERLGSEDADAVTGDEDVDGMSGGEGGLRHEQPEGGTGRVLRSRRDMDQQSCHDVLRFQGVGRPIIRSSGPTFVACQKSRRPAKDASTKGRVSS